METVDAKKTDRIESYLYKQLVSAEDTPAEPALEEAFLLAGNAFELAVGQLISNRASEINEALNNLQNAIRKLRAIEKTLLREIGGDEGFATPWGDESCKGDGAIFSIEYLVERISSGKKIKPAS